MPCVLAELLYRVLWQSTNDTQWRARWDQVREERTIRYASTTIECRSKADNLINARQTGTETREGSIESHGHLAAVICDKVG